jgi:hypothetical protein
LAIPWSPPSAATLARRAVARSSQIETPFEANDLAVAEGPGVPLFQAALEAARLRD